MKQLFIEHLWVISGIIAAYLGIHISLVYFSENGLFYAGVAAVVIMSSIMALLGIIVWLLIRQTQNNNDSELGDWSTETTGERKFKKHWIEIATVLLVIIIFIGYIILHVSSLGEFNSERLSAVAFPALIACQMIQIAIIFRSYYLIKTFLNQHSVISEIEQLEQLKPIVSQCMIMALVFIFMMLASMLLAAVVFTSWDIQYGIITAFSLTLVAIIMKWYTPHENKLKQINATDPLLEKELESILQSWHNDGLPKF